MEVCAAVYHEDKAAFCGLASDSDLQRAGARFGGMIHFTNPPCLDAWWPEANGQAASDRLRALGCRVVVTKVHNPEAARRVPATVLCLKKRALDLDTELGGRLEPACSVPVRLDWSEHRKAWWGAVAKVYLTGMEVRGVGVTGVELRSGGVVWSADLPTGVLLHDIPRPGGIVWPLALDSFYEPGVVVRSPPDSRPEVTVRCAVVRAEQSARLLLNDVFSYRFHSPQGALARWTCGLNTLVLSWWDEAAVAEVRAANARHNSAVDTDPFESVPNWQVERL